LLIGPCLIYFYLREIKILLKSLVYEIQINIEDMLHQHFCLKPFATALGIFERVQFERVCLCIESNGRHFERCCN